MRHIVGKNSPAWMWLVIVWLVSFVSFSAADPRPAGTLYRYSDGQVQIDSRPATLEFVLTGNSVTCGKLSAQGRHADFSGTLTGTWNSPEWSQWDGRITGNWTGVDYTPHFNPAAINPNYDAPEYRVESGTILLQMTNSGAVKVTTTVGSYGYYFPSRPVTAAAPQPNKPAAPAVDPLGPSTTDPSTMRLDLNEGPNQSVLAKVIDTRDGSLVSPVDLDLRVFRTYDCQMGQWVNGQYRDIPKQSIPGSLKIQLQGSPGDYYRVDAYASKPGWNRSDRSIVIIFPGGNRPPTTPAPAPPSTSAPGPSATFILEALVDGDSDLHVTPEGLYWVNGRWSKPGRHGGLQEATYVNGQAWYPRWATPAETGTDQSDVFAIKAAAGPIRSVKLLMVGPQRNSSGIESRQPISTRQQGADFVIHIPDGESGSRWYRLQVGP